VGPQLEWCRDRFAKMFFKGPPRTRTPRSTENSTPFRAGIGCRRCFRNPPSRGTWSGCVVPLVIPFPTSSASGQEVSSSTRFVSRTLCQLSIPALTLNLSLSPFVSIFRPKSSHSPPRLRSVLTTGSGQLPAFFPLFGPDASPCRKSVASRTVFHVFVEDLLVSR